jgi:hemerythrin-like domain-containing protein
MKITDALLGEHGAFYAQFDRLEQVLPHAASAGEVREQAGLLAAALVSHARLEDEVLFRRMAQAGGDPGLLRTMEDEHGEIAALLARAQVTADLEAARSILLEAVALARDHFAKEERVAFPMAESLLDGGTLSDLGSDWAGRRVVFLAPATPA